MNEEQQVEAQRRDERGFRLSPVWLVPLAVALIGGWLVYQNLVSRGPTVILEADTAEGLNAGKTPVKVRSVEVGQVDAVRLSDDYSGAVIELQMNPGTEDLLAEDSRFWVVKPRVGRRGISGLNTILSGAYVQMRPGKSEETAHRFEMLDRPPVSRSDAPGVSIMLTSKGHTSVNIGDPIVYQGQRVGRIETADYQPEAEEMRYSVFIQRPYDDLITQNTQFWSRSGVDFQLTSEGMQVQMSSLEAIVSGGLTFGVPEGMPAGEPVDNGAEFTIYPSEEAAQQERFNRKIKYVVLFRDSVRGLNTGAPVEFNGIRVGTVEQVPFFRDEFGLNRFADFRIPVLISFEPQRLGPAWADRSLAEWRDELHGLFQRGLRASVRPGNLLTGAMFIDLQFTDAETGYELVKLGEYPIFPSQKSSLAGLEQKINALLDKLNNLELGETVNKLNGTLSASNDTLNQMESTLASLDKVLDSENARELPQALRTTLEDIQVTLKSFRQGQPTYENVNKALRRLNTLLEDLTPLAQTLRRQPDALLFGREAEEDPIPEAKQ